jgi:hypothetical protein
LKKKESKEETTERRHRERLDVQKAAISSFKKMMQKLIDKL